jgi:phosphate transport system permease protein
MFFSAPLNNHSLRLNVVGEKILYLLLLASAFVSVLITLAIVLSIVFEAVHFFRLVPITDFIFGTHWSPQMALRADQAGSSGAFGVIPVFLGTLMITLIAILVAAPLGIFSAVFLTEYAKPIFRQRAKPALELLAGIPTVVYGYFAASMVGPWFREMGEIIGLSISTESALVAGVVMGLMMIPFVLSLTDDVLHSLPQHLRDGALALGSTRAEMIYHVLIPAAMPGILSALLLAISRAIGETMIVVMAAGLSASLTANPLESVTTVTVQIVHLLVGDHEFNSPKTLAAFALGLLLFLVTLTLNIVALRIVNKYRRRYFA